MSKTSRKTETKKQIQKNDTDLTNIIVIVITAIIIAVLVSVSIIMTKTKDKSEEPKPEIPPQHTSDSDNPLNYVTTYETKDTGTVVSEAESKTLAYFNSHYKDDYYKVSEIVTSAVIDGSYTEYYETVTTAYSTDGYLYQKKCLAPYDEQDYTSADIFLYTPESAYRIMPDMKSYFMGEGNTQGYTNTIDFPTENFKIKTVNIYGREYYCEEYRENTNGQIITYQYCFDETDDLRYVITSAASGTITERYIEYSKDVDYSLFEIPEDYTLVQ